MRKVNILKNYWLAALAGATLTLGAPAWAVLIVQPQISGQVTAMAGGVSITIGNVTYQIAAGSAASQYIQNVHVGDTVGLVLNGPAGSSGSEVVAIVAAAGQSTASQSK